MHTFVCPESLHLGNKINGELDVVCLAGHCDHFPSILLGSEGWRKEERGSGRGRKGGRKGIEEEGGWRREGEGRREEEVGREEGKGRREEGGREEGKGRRVQVGVCRGEEERGWRGRNRRKRDRMF